MSRMRFPFLMLAVALSACSVGGPPRRGIVPQPVDLHAADVVSLKGSAVLAAPSGWSPAPTLVTPTFPVAAPQLLAAMRESLLAAPRSWQTVAYPEQNQAFFIVRSVALDLPDIVVVQAVAAGPATSQAVIYSHSRYDILPYMSENRARVQHLVDALVRRFGTVLPPPAARPVTGSAPRPPAPAAAPAASPAPPAAETPRH